MASVTFEHVTKRFDTTTAIDDFSLEIADKEFLVLVGPSGCGKSTALRCLAGLEEITEGVIRIGDQVVNNLPAKDRDLAMVFQSYALYPHMTVYDNMAFGLSLRHVPNHKSVNESKTPQPLSELMTFCSAAHAIFPGASDSALHSGGRSSATPRCSCSMSRFRTLMPSCVCKRVPS